MSLIFQEKIYKIAAMAAAMLLSVPATEAREFRVSDTQAGDYPTVQALNYMAKLVAENTGGRHSIRVFHSRQLGEEKETIEQTRVGAIDLNRTNVAPIGSIVPAANVLALPFLFRSFDHLHNVLDKEIGSEILASFERHGFVGLTFYDSGARSIYNSVRPVRSLADMKGLRIRVQQSELMVDMIKALGAEPIEMPYGQVGTGLSTRLIDGAENNWPSYVTTGHYKVASYYTLTEHTMGPEVLVMSQPAWESLSAQDKEIFRDAARKSSTFMRDLWTGLEERSRQQARAAGNTITANFDRKPFENAMIMIYDKAVTAPDLRQLVERIRQVQ
jgi:tripartite ATP-independent transporter DctP family solute receptor